MDKIKQTIIDLVNSIKLKIQNLLMIGKVRKTEKQGSVQLSMFLTYNSRLSKYGYAYDPLGSRVRKTVEAHDGSAWSRESDYTY